MLQVWVCCCSLHLLRYKKNTSSENNWLVVRKDEREAEFYGFVRGRGKCFSVWTSKWQNLGPRVIKTQPCAEKKKKKLLLKTEWIKVLQTKAQLKVWCQQILSTEQKGSGKREPEIVFPKRAQSMHRHREREREKDWERGGAKRQRNIANHRSMSWKEHDLWHREMSEIKQRRIQRSFERSVFPKEMPMWTFAVLNKGNLGFSIYGKKEVEKIAQSPRRKYSPKINPAVVKMMANKEEPPQWRVQMSQEIIDRGLFPGQESGSNEEAIPIPRARDPQTVCPGEFIIGMTRD